MDSTTAPVQGFPVPLESQTPATLTAQVLSSERVFSPPTELGDLPYATLTL